MPVTISAKRPTVSVSPAHCMGCHSCELACAVAHSASKDLFETVRVGERPGYRVVVEKVARVAVPMRCNQCEDAACAAACPTGACRRSPETALVLVDDERCIGCRMCVQACPFGAIVMKPGGKSAIKCDLCVDRLAVGQQPACVEACPTPALAFGDEEDSAREKRLRAAEQLVRAAQAGAASLS